MKEFSGHSIKRGAISHLLVLMAQGVDIPEILLARLAKHKTAAGLPEITIRYGANEVALARAMKTGEVTKYL